MCAGTDFRTLPQTNDGRGSFSGDRSAIRLLALARPASQRKRHSAVRRRRRSCEPSKHTATIITWSFDVKAGGRRPRQSSALPSSSKYRTRLRSSYMSVFVSASASQASLNYPCLSHSSNPSHRPYDARPANANADRFHLLRTPHAPRFSLAICASRTFLKHSLWDSLPLNAIRAASISLSGR